MSKEHIGRLSAIMVAKGVEQVVVSPGSRNAPVIIIFGQNKNLKLLSVADERSAGFFALGLAIQSQKPVALLCTSGSAVLNYAPAIAEAYYQKIPLLVMTADRPIELIDQGDSQTIRQHNVFSNYIRRYYYLPVAINTEGERWFIDRVLNEAIDRTQYPVPGPVHVNIPLDEPLYDLTAEFQKPVKIINYQAGKVQLDNVTLDRLSGLWNTAKSKLVLVGQMPPSQELRKFLCHLSEDPTVVILTETTSNVADYRFINCIDRTLALIPAEKNSEFTPEILMTFGGAIVSKKVKAMLRSMKPQNHWHISNDPEEFHFDTYKSLTLTIAVDPLHFLQPFTEKVADKLNPPALSTVSYSEKWQKIAKDTAEKHQQYLNKIEFSDLKAYERIFQNLPEGTAIHLGNSTPVRYAQLFDHNGKFAFYSNRGTSGIDGCASTATGFAFNNPGLTLLITGDIGFFYDSNALWNDNLNETLRIVLINNGGGNIFRIIEGPSDYEELEPFIETRHHLDAAGITSNFNIEYYCVENEEQLQASLPNFLAPQSSGRPALLEIKTNNLISAKTLRDYFAFLRK